MRLYKCDFCETEAPPKYNGVPAGWSRLQVKILEKGSDYVWKFDVCEACAPTKSDFKNTKRIIELMTLIHKSGDPE